MRGVKYSDLAETKESGIMDKWSPERGGRL